MTKPSHLWWASHQERLLAIMQNERAHLIEALSLAVSSCRIRFHSGCQQHFFTLSAIRRKLRRLAETI
jgi:hypothetical protein